MDANDQKEAKLDLGLMRISLSETDGILGEEAPEEEEALAFDLVSAKVPSLTRIHSDSRTIGLFSS
jgi:hypothetical protein